MNTRPENLSPSDREVQDHNGHWYLARMRPYRTADDKIDGLVLTFVDITAHKESEIALRHSEERYRALFESMDEGFCVIEQVSNADNKPELRILVANPAFQKLTGLENAAGQNIKDIAPEQLHFWEDIFNRLDKAPDCKRFECANDAFNRWLEVSSFRLSNVYGPHVAVLLKDIHEQKCIEEELRESSKRDAFRVAAADAFRSARAPNEIQEIGCRMLGEYFHVDNIIYGECNPDGETTNEFEYKAPATIVSGRFYPWQNNEGLHEKFIAGQRLYVSNTSENPNLTPWQLTQCHSLGIRAFVSIPVVYDKQLVAMITVLHSDSLYWLEPDLLLVKEIAERIFDAVERAGSEQAISQRELQLREADQRKNEFIAVLSHELRNPLAPILNALQVIQIVDPNSQAHKDAQVVVRRQVGLMSRLIDDLLDITRIAKGKIQLKTGKVELNKLISQALRDHLSIFEKNELTLGFEPAPNELWVKADQSRLLQAIGNLLQNCAKFTSAGGTTNIYIAADEKNAEIRIKDSGIGMSQDLIEQIFQPFIQGESTLERSKGGLGLGLALCKRLVELHNGTITAHSTGIGAGAEFRIQLPLINAPQQSIKRQGNKQEAAPRRILIIEDNTDSADTLRTLLHHRGHETAVANDGSNGINCAREFKPDFIICDIGLPIVNGYDVATEIKSDKDLNQIILVALSGYAMPEDIERAANAGFDYYLKKPADLKKLDEILIGDSATI